MIWGLMVTFPGHNSRLINWRLHHYAPQVLNFRWGWWSFWPWYFLMAMVMLLGCYIGGKVLVATYIISKTCAQITKNQLSEALVVLSFSMPSELIICLKCSNDDWGQEGWPVTKQECCTPAILKKPFQASCVPLGPTSLYHIESTFMKVPFQMCPTAEKIHFNMNFVFGKWYDRPAWWLLRSQWSRWSKRMLPKRFQTLPLFEILQNPPRTVKELFPISTQNCMKKLHVEPDWTWQNNESQFWRWKTVEQKRKYNKGVMSTQFCNSLHFEAFLPENESNCCTSLTSSRCEGNFAQTFLFDFNV